MVNILSTAQLVQRFSEFLRSAQPDLDTKPGTVSKDLFVDGPSVRVAELYNEISTVSNSQSLSQSVGEDIENLGSNFGLVKLEPGKSSGIALLCFNSLSANIPVPGGSLLYARNGASFRVISGFVIQTFNESQYRGIANTYKSDLDAAGISDIYAVQAVVECTSAGTAGNIPKYSLINSSIPGVTSVTNIASFNGGSSGENDASFKNRVLAIFSGSNTGTELGYKNIIVSNPAVLSTIVIGPGNPLMTRDNTILLTDRYGNLVLDDDANPTIKSEGTGGKVDIFVYGRRLTENVDSFIYNDKSGRNDPTDSSNDFVIGQIEGDENKTITRRRYDNILNGALPSQPVENVIEVIGSRSGTFTPQIVDANGNFVGNYTLLKDTGVYSGSVWGFDKLHFVANSNSKSEDVSRGTFNGQDTLTYSDCLEIQTITRVINVLNENAIPSSTNRAELTLSHTPIKAINRVLNVTTGERYVVSDRNPGGNSSNVNTSGKILISGRNLPSVSDVLQVDYEWEYNHDIYTDVDSFNLKDNPRTAIDVVDWGYGNAIRREQQVVDTGYAIAVEHNVSSVISVNKVNQQTAVISFDAINNTKIIVLTEVVTNVVSVLRSSDSAELYNTIQYDGSYEGFSIILPSDTSGVVGDNVLVTYNALDLFTVSGISGNFKNNTIYLPQAANSLVTLYSDIVEVNYIANISELLPSTNFSNLPATKYKNNFVTSSLLNVGVQPVTNVYSVGDIVLGNLRKTPAKLGLNVNGISSNGVLNITGTTVTLIKDTVFNSTGPGLKLDLSLVIKKALGLDLYTDLPSSIKVCKLVYLEKVELTNNVVTNVLNEFDLVGYGIQDKSMDYDKAISITSLRYSEVQLPNTDINALNSPVTGETFRISFYVSKTSDEELISFSTNGTLYTNKTFAYVDSINVSSGFKVNNALVGSVSMFALSQPNSGSRYKTIYSYVAPKNGERITVRYNNNALIGDLTLSIEDQRPVTSDVVIKTTGGIGVDFTATIEVLKEFKKTKYVVAQNVADKIASYINNLSLGAMLNPSDLTNVAYQVNGLDSIVVERFNVAGVLGNVNKIKTLKIQYLQANNITIKV